MGVFRVLLAIAVFMSHSHDDGAGKLFPVMYRDVFHVYIWSGHAVFAFFVISGFYISMVMDQKYDRVEGGIWKFYLNRSLRLFPTNWVFLAAFALYYAVSGTPSFLSIDVPDADWWAKPAAAFSNIFFVGTEAIPLFNKANWAYIINAPAWSLSVEIYFYLLAPFVVCRSLKMLLGLTAIFFCWRLSLYFSGAEAVQWLYFFAPADFVFFLMGALSYRLYGAIRGQTWARYAGPVALLILIGSICYQPFWVFPSHDQWQSWAFYVTVAICTPFAFLLTKNNPIDNFIGQLAYPLYIGQVFAITLAEYYYSGSIDVPTVSFALIIVMSIAIYLGVDRPIEKLRHRISQARYLHATSPDDVVLGKQAPA